MLSSRVRPSTARVLFLIFFVEEKGFEYSEYDDDSDERTSDFVIDDSMLFFLFFEPNGEDDNE